MLVGVPDGIVNMLARAKPTNQVLAKRWQFNFTISTELITYYVNISMANFVHLKKMKHINSSMCGIISGPITAMTGLTNIRNLNITTFFSSF